MKITNAVREEIYGDEREFTSGHASTLVQLASGDILAAWFGGAWEKSPDVAIYISRRSSEAWGKPVKIADTRGIALWNPVLYRHTDNTVFLFYKEGKIISEWRTMVMTSRDDGQSFSEPKELVAGDIGGRGPVKNKPILLENGHIIAPASLEGELWDCFADISTDGGITWNKSSLVPLRRMTFTEIHSHTQDPSFCYGKGIIQPTLWESSPGNVHMLTRSTSSAIFRSDSEDGGFTWSCAYQTGLPNNNSGLDLVKLPGGGLVLAYNPTNNLPNYYKGPRNPLVLDYSADNGKTWQRLYTLEGNRGSYAYPAIIATESQILLTYTMDREKIIFFTLDYN